MYGYQLPKWLTEINVNIGPTEVQANLTDISGKVDLSLSTVTPALKHVKPESRMSEATMLHLVDNIWHQTLVQTNILLFTQKILPRKVKLIRHGGPLSQLLDELGASTILRLDVIADAQVVLNLPKPLDAVDFS